MIRIHGHADDAARDAAASVVAAVLDALAKHERARIAVSGGRTPKALHARIALDPRPVEWERVDVYFADERAVRADDPESNYRLAVRSLAEPLGGRPRLHRMRADAADREEALAEYERALERPLDLVVLGMGADGHTASLFPGSPLLEEPSRRVAWVYDSPKPPAVRMTLLPRAIREAGTRMMLATGAEKADAVTRALEGPFDPVACPAQLARDGLWFLDRDAALGIRADGDRS